MKGFSLTLLYTLLFVVGGHLSKAFNCDFIRNTNNWSFTNANNDKGRRKQTLINVVTADSRHETEKIEQNDFNSKVFLRFSPLVGGPKIIPIHLEVMVLVSEKNIESRSTQKLSQCLHRFDFLPMNPNNKTTIIKLLSLQSVPGSVRHKILINEDAFETGEDVEDYSTKCCLEEEKNNVILVPNIRIQRLLGNLDEKSVDNSFTIQNNEYSGLSVSIKIRDDAKIHFTRRENDILHLPLEVPERIRNFLEVAEGRQLHLINNNCYSFSWEVLKSLMIVT